jgi:hypothetical protein
VSYSRWSNSSWYTFYNASSGAELSEQVLSAWYSLDKCIDWTYAELEELVKNRLRTDEITDRIRYKYGCSEDEATELYDYIQQFMADARANFK